MRRYHHMGIPTKGKHSQERYVPEFKMYTWGYETSEFHIQWHRYEKRCPLPKLVQEVAHVAFQVDDIETAIKGKKVIVPPFFPVEGFKVAFIEENGAPIEFIETHLSEKEVFERAKKKSIYKQI